MRRNPTIWQASVLGRGSIGEDGSGPGWRARNGPERIPSDGAGYSLKHQSRFRPNRLIVVALLIGVFTVTTTGAAVISSLLGTPPIAIEVRAEPITAFDQHDPSRQRFGQLEFRGGLTLTSSYREFGGLSAIRIAPDGASKPQTHPRLFAEEEAKLGKRPHWRRSMTRLKEFSLKRIRSAAWARQPHCRAAII